MSDCSFINARLAHGCLASGFIGARCPIAHLINARLADGSLTSGIFGILCPIMCILMYIWLMVAPPLALFDLCD